MTETEPQGGPTVEPRRDARRRSRPLRAGLAAAGCLVALAVLAVILSGVVVRQSEERQAFGPGGEMSRIQIGDEAPDFTLYSVDESPVQLSDFRGSSVVLNFWASWCLPCIIEIPALNRAAADYRDEGVVVIGVNEAEPPSKAIEYIQKRGVEYLVLLDPLETAGNLYGIVGMPTTVWIDPDGRIRAVDHGALDDETIAQRIADLAGRGPSPDAASGGTPDAAATPAATNAADYGP